MQAIFDFLNAISTILDGIGNFLTNLITEIVYVVRITSSVLDQIPSIFNWLPSTIASMILLILGVAVVYKVIGREG